MRYLTKYWYNKMQKGVMNSLTYDELLNFSVNQGYDFVKYF
jgi:hypothetical protein